MLFHGKTENNGSKLHEVLFVNFLKIVLFVPHPFEITTKKASQPLLGPGWCQVVVQWSTNSWKVNIGVQTAGHMQTERTDLVSSAQSQLSSILSNKYEFTVILL